jgi:hypothetical protein
VTAESVVENEGAPAALIPARRSFLDLLVVRLSAEYGVDPQLIRRQGAEWLESFAGARIQAFVPILVEKRLRTALRGLSGPGRTLAAHLAAHEEPAAIAG